MTNINYSDESICSTSYFQKIFNLALHKKYNKIETINLKRKLYRQSLIKEKLGSLNIDIETYNYKEMRQEDSFFKDSLESFNINDGNSFLDNLNSLIKLRDWHLLNFYYKEQDDNDKSITEFCKKEALKEIERKKNKFLKKFFKQNPQFKQAIERKGCDCLLFFNIFDLNFLKIYINDERNEDQNKFIESCSHEIIFLNNKNPRDGKLVTRSFIKHKVSSKKICPNKIF